jgi:hypothetical protein
VAKGLQDLDAIGLRMVSINVMTEVDTPAPAQDGFKQPEFVDSSVWGYL